MSTAATSRNVIRLRADGSEWEQAINLSERRNEWELTRRGEDDRVERCRARLATFAVIFTDPSAEPQPVFDFVRDASR